MRQLIQLITCIQYVLYKAYIICPYQCFVIDLHHIGCCVTNCPVINATVDVMVRDIE